MIKPLTIALVLSAAATLANASDWVDLGNDRTSNVFLDADSIKYANKALDQRTAWVKVKYIRPDGPYKAGDYTLASQTIDCRNGRFSVSRVIAYNPKGQMTQQTPMNTGWMDIPPDSTFEYVAETVCSYPYL